jgi:hypothetical protein
MVGWKGLPRANAPAYYVSCGLYYKNMTIVNDASSWSITLVMNYALRVVNYAPREHLWYWLHLQSSLMIVIYDCKTFIVQAREY